MASSDRIVKVSFIADASSLNRASASVGASLSKVSTQVGKASSDTGSAFSKIGDHTKAVSGHFSSMASSVGSSMAKFAKVAAVGALAGVAGLAGFGKGAITAASNLSESLGKANVVFGAQAKEIEKWADTASRSFGQSKQQALEAAGTFGNLFQAFGVGKTQSAVMSKSLVELAADLASFNNTSIEDALAAISSGLSGETEPLKKYGAILSDDRLRLEAVRLGLIKTVKDGLDPAAKSQAAYSLIVKDTALAHGDFARTSDGLANRTRILKARFADIQAEIGTKLLPVVVKLAGFVLDKVLPAFEKLSSGVGRVLREIRSGFAEGVNSKGFAGSLQRIGDVAHTVFTEVRGGIRAFIAAFKANDGDITSSGLPGFFERLGFIARRVFEFLKVAVPKVLEGIGKVITHFVIPAIQAMAKGFQNDILPAVKKFGDSFKKDLLPVLEKRVLPVLKLLGEAIVRFVIPAYLKYQAFLVGTLIPALFKVINFISEKFIPALVDAAKWVGEKLGPPFKAFAGFITDDVVPAVAGLVKFFKDDLLPKVQPVIEKFVEFGTTAFNLAKDVGEALHGIVSKVAEWDIKVIGFVTDVLGWFRDMPGKIGGFFGSLVDIIVSPFRTAFNLIIDAYNNTLGKIPSVGFSIGGVGITTPHFPHLDHFATGGIVGGPVGMAKLAIVHGGEQVLTPAQRRTRERTSGGGGRMQTINFIVDGKVLTSVLVDHANRSGGINLRIRNPS